VDFGRHCIDSIADFAYFDRASLVLDFQGDGNFPSKHSCLLFTNFLSLEFQRTIG